jgi:hypothetical protein
MILPPSGITDFVVRQTDYLGAACVVGNQIVQPDPTRVVLVVVSPAAQFAISIVNNTTGNTGWWVISSNPAVEITWAKHGALVSEGWYITFAPGPNPFSTFEVLYRPASKSNG